MLRLGRSPSIPEDEDETERSFLGEEGASFLKVGKSGVSNLKLLDIAGMVLTGDCLGLSLTVGASYSGGN